ncbi:hypothetical protein [Paenibacillus luteus]|uniref:hypothetical protein n=1 Tax=Paenibacillus luteus TaxID=2545753 RepID=UPI001142047F|nr:hypothetical protein [Paenibacillus luteus]
MNKTFIQNRLTNALRRLYHFDKEIIANHSNERSICHRLAVHLGVVFYEWDVDVEYNRNLGDRKTFSLDIMSMLNDISKEDLLTGRRSVYPDIIVHKRGTNQNLIAIEVKKSTSSQRLDAFDQEKIKGYVLEESLQYQFGAFIKLGETKVNQLVIKSKQEVLEEVGRGELDFG